PSEIEGLCLRCGNAASIAATSTSLLLGSSLEGIFYEQLTKLERLTARQISKQNTTQHDSIPFKSIQLPQL
ncbi:MAG: hypothetical protein ACPGIC_05325, partial [Opitutales bacterium]